MKLRGTKREERALDIRLIDIDSTKPNLALCKISNYFKSKGHNVDFYNPLYDHPDKIYASKVFTFTEDYQYFPTDCEVIKGGSGYDLVNKLPDEIEHQRPDYGLYDFNVYNTKGKKLGAYAMGFTSRGCCNNCKFCLVPCKEGKTHEVADIYEFWNGQSHIMLLDNNLTSLPNKFEKTCKQLIKEKIHVDFSQGLDIRLIDADKAKLLSKLKLWKQIHFAFDDIRLEKQFLRGYNVLINNGVKPYKMMSYVLIGFNSTPEEDLYRVNLLRSLNVDPFIMPYKDINGKEKLEDIIKRCGFDSKKAYEEYKQKFARWGNHKAIYKTIEFKDYKAS